MCVFSLSVKAMHLELVSEQGKPSLIWSDHGSNFVGASRPFNELIEFMKKESYEGISNFCSSQIIVW